MNNTSLAFTACVAPLSRGQFFELSLDTSENQIDDGKGVSKCLALCATRV